MQQLANTLFENVKIERKTVLNQNILKTDSINWTVVRPTFHIGI
jgi:hypothetical protein